MEKIESYTDLRGIELSVFFMESSLALHMKHQVSSTDEFNYKKETTWSLEAGMKSDEEGMVRRSFKHMLFCLYPINILKRKIETSDNKLFLSNCERYCCSITIPTPIPLYLEEQELGFFEPGRKTVCHM